MAQMMQIRKKGFHHKGSPAKKARQHFTTATTSVTLGAQASISQAATDTSSSSALGAASVQSSPQIAGVSRSDCAPALVLSTAPRQAQSPASLPTGASSVFSDDAEFERLIKSRYRRRRQP